MKIKNQQWRPASTHIFPNRLILTMPLLPSPKHYGVPLTLPLEAD